MRTRGDRALVAMLGGALALLAGSGPAMALPKQATAATYSDRLARLTEVQRFAALRRAVLDSGQSCKKVLAAAHQGPWKNLDMWVVRCAQPTTDYGAFLGPDGSVQVSTCADVAKVALPRCRRL